MPKLSNPSDQDICALCGSHAYYISINSKKLRCVEKITQCSGFINKANKSREKNMTSDERIHNMKMMSIKGNKKLKELHNDEEWLKRKSKHISEAIIVRGSHSGKQNPMYGKFHNNDTINKMKEKAVKRDRDCYVRATNTKIKKGIAISKEKKTQWELYREQVLNVTRKNWIQYQKIINPMNLTRGPDFELDHKFSIIEGFNNNVPPEIIGHSGNLELLPKKENRAKRTKCSITINQLYQMASIQ